jgi:tRNA(Ile)-lysidine synthase TilS/MesJ
MRKLVGNIIKADKIFNMVEDGDRICIGISGGKDSMALLFAMNLYKNILAKENIFIEVIGVHLKMNLCALDYTEITEF